MKYFQGDGRQLMHPTKVDVYPGTKPMTVSLSQANRIVEAFVGCGHSNHTSAGSTLWVIRRYSREAQLPITMRVIPGAGFNVALIGHKNVNKLEKNHSDQSRYARSH